MKPKFRAWDKFDKEMLDVHGINYDADGVWTKEMIDDESDGEFIHFSDIELLQSTGLFDKNGKEIFEGDILKVEYGDLLGETRETLIIAKNPFEYSMEEAKFLDFSYIVEIIGNKFEHPHLLGED
ncbi:YopX family protein [Mammaliicoccus sciuri]|uniref:YopX family protein n=1 Tax=Mammaliicoccus sciuri TaxID=1296 RepID=UPI000E6A22D2|nr:YopX family protein [Mammaliicoccus sciuri]RIN79448.1 hypothetical protein BU007_09130 [Mammaliicoccus sciuri]